MTRCYEGLGPILRSCRPAYSRGDFATSAVPTTYAKMVRIGKAIVLNRTPVGDESKHVGTALAVDQYLQLLPRLKERDSLWGDLNRLSTLGVST